MHKSKQFTSRLPMAGSLNNNVNSNLISTANSSTQKTYQHLSKSPSSSTSIIYLQNSAKTKQSNSENPFSTDDPKKISQPFIYESTRNSQQTAATHVIPLSASASAFVLSSNTVTPLVPATVSNIQLPQRKMYTEARQLLTKLSMHAIISHRGDSYISMQEESL